MRNRWWIAPAVAAAAVVLAACGTSSGGTADPSTSSNPPATSTGNTTAAGTVTIKTLSTSKGTVLVDSAGKTLYWFAKDTRSRSRCNGSCATYWPPVIGKPVAAAGTSLSGTFGTIKRRGGALQATYDGHPLYTYSGDSAAGQVNGNDINASGGLWWAITPSGAKLKAKASSSSGSSGSSGSSSGSGW